MQPQEEQNFWSRPFYKEGSDIPIAIWKDNPEKTSIILPRALIQLMQQPPFFGSNADMHFDHVQ